MEISLSSPHPEETAGLVNAVKKAYMEEVVDMDNNRRRARRDKLKKIHQTYQELLKERWETLSKFTETMRGDDRLRVTGLKRPELLSLHHSLWTKHVDLQLERAAAEADLARRKKTAGSADRSGPQGHRPDRGPVRQPDCPGEGY